MILANTKGESCIIIVLDTSQKEVMKVNVCGSRGSRPGLIELWGERFQGYSILLESTIQRQRFSNDLDNAIKVSVNGRA